MTAIQGISISALEAESAEFERRVVAAIRRVLRESTSKLGLTIVAQGAAASISPDDINGIVPAWVAVVDAELLPLAVENYVRALNEQVQQLFEELGDRAGEFPLFNSQSQAVQAYASGARNRLVGIGDDAWQNARTALVEGLSLGESIPNLSRRVQDSIDVTTGRATTIARTEIISASNGGSLAAVRASGLVVQKRWIATNDGRTRESHRAADGQIVEIAESFSVGGASLDHPGDFTGPPDEVINCRCTMGYEVDDSQEALRTENEGPLSDDEWSDEIIVSASKENIVPWHIVEDSSQCPASEPYAVVKDGDGELEGCHATRDEAEAQLAALNIAEQESSTHDTVVAAAEHDAYGMIALIPRDEDLQRIVHADGDPVEELHVTLVFLGEVKNLTEQAIRVAHDAAEEAAHAFRNVDVEARVAGKGSLGNEDPSASVLFLNGREMSELHGRVCSVLGDYGWEAYHEQYEPWIPHLTVGYGVDLDTIELPDEPVVFDRVRVVVAGEVVDYQLNDTIASSALSVHASQEASVWHIDNGHPDAPADRPWSIVRQSDNKIIASFTHGWQAIEHFETLKASQATQHDTSEKPADAPAEPADEAPDAPEAGALAAETSTFQEEDGECPPGHHRMPDGECMADEDMAGESNSWEGVLAVEGVPTGDGRMFAENSLSWPDPAEVTVALRWQKEDSHGGMQVNGVVNVGRITEIWRDGNKIMGRGTFDIGHEDGAEARRRMANGDLTGVSIDADDPEDPMGLDIEFVYPEGCESGGVIDLMDEEAEVEMNCLFPELVVFHSGRIRAATLVDLPAFIEARLNIVDTVTASAGTDAFGAVRSHETATSDDSWDGSANEGRLPSPMPVATARAAYAWIDTDRVEDGEVVKDACRFIHHEVSEDGTPGAANLTACSTGIGVLNGARGGTNIPAADRQGVYDHLARHLRDADREPPPLEAAVDTSVEAVVASLTASTHLLEIPGRPPREWFDEPTDVPDIGAMTVTDEGRVYGYLAPKNVAHRGFTDRRVEVPTKNVDYERWMNRVTIVAGGERIATGPITMECGHASTAPWVGADASIDHYDNSCSVVAAVRIGENSKGVWIAGALLPDVKPEQVARMMMCQLSGDWRPHRERAGMRELTAALLVPVPGFPMENSRVQLRMDHGQLVASAVPVRFTRLDEDVKLLELKKSGQRPTRAESTATDELRSQARALAHDLGRDKMSRDQKTQLRELAASVRGDE